ncbi:xylose isomerase-like protein [Meira miltonrushii]|uniref:Xylose isomerase-like protein n=1 Tax=Meira miltonrushii TaxID=1280837 RepID=A0A316VB48_9BASI|nr:xylose isomerase-like protein [Meira miltonrushii]PWN34752.1 xylose isomerase-like protein [Meira miltonrushii]
MSLANKTKEPLKGATFGNPIKHSVGPLVHNHVAKILNIPWSFDHGEYASVEEVHEQLRDGAFGMGAITMPFKSTIMPFLNGIDEEANAIGAVNTISHLNKDGKDWLQGHNTDAAGIAQVFNECTSLSEIPQRIGLVIGSGGAARAAVWALLMTLKCTSVMIVARYANAVEDMINSFKEIGSKYGIPIPECVFHVKSVQHAKRLLAQGVTPSLAVSCIPDPLFEAANKDVKTQSEGKEQERQTFAILDQLLVGRLHRRQRQSTPCIFLDMCFKPMYTSLMRLAETDGWTVIGGIEVLGAQLIEQWRIWLGEGNLFDSIPQDQVRAKMRELAINSTSLQVSTSQSRPKSLHERLKSMPQGIMSASLGSGQVHDIESKIRATKEEGFEGIEIFYECLRLVSVEIAGKSSSEQPTDDELRAGAKKVRQLCDKYGVFVIALQPWLNYVGLKDRKERDRRLEQVLPLWFELADLLGTNTMQIPSQMYKNISTNDPEVVIDDLRKLAEAGLYGREKQGKNPIRFAYEAMAFGAFTSRWQDAWEEVVAVDMPNFGIVLDTFQILGECWADPASPSGVLYDAEIRLQESLHDLRTTFAGHLEEQTKNRRKVFYVQVGDAERFPEPLNMENSLFDLSMHANIKMAWNRSCRTFACEGYLPLLPLLKVLFQDIRFEGMVSAELMNVNTSSKEETFPLRSAQRARVAWQKCVDLLIQESKTPSVV